MASKSVAELKRAAEQARKYVAKIGARQPHFRPDAGGRLAKLEISTEICHQANPSDTNYWNESDFDKALAQVVRQRFGELAQDAFALMDAAYKSARIAEKDSLLVKLAEIEALEGADE